MAARRESARRGGARAGSGRRWRPCRGRGPRPAPSRSADGAGRTARRTPYIRSAFAAKATPGEPRYALPITSACFRYWRFHRGPRTFPGDDLVAPHLAATPVHISPPRGCGDVNSRVKPPPKLSLLLGGGLRAFHELHERRQDGRVVLGPGGHGELDVLRAVLDRLVGHALAVQRADRLGDEAEADARRHEPDHGLDLRDLLDDLLLVDDAF